MKKVWFTMVFLLLMAAVANADIILPTIDSESNTNVYSTATTAHLHDNSGMTPAVNAGDSLASALAALHANSGVFESWVTNAAAPDYFATQPAPVIVWDLTGGGNTPVGTAIFWQYQNDGGGSNRVGNHTRTIELQFNTEAQGAAAFAGGVTTLKLKPNLNDPVAEQNTAQGFDLGGGSYRYVRMAVTDNHFGDPDGFGVHSTVGGDRVGLGEVRFATESPPWAKSPTLIKPLAGDSPTLWDLTLEWIPGGSFPNPDGYNIYLDPNESKVDDPAAGGLAPENGVTLDPDPNWPVTGLTPGETYFWKVVAVESATPDPNYYASNIATFTTLPETPIFTKDIVNQTVLLYATDIEFTVEALNVEPGDLDDGYQWYKDGKKMPGETSNTLTFLPNVALGDEGYYHCVAHNEAGEESSKTARLVTKRLLAHWEFESDNMNDTAPGGYHHGTIFPIGGDPNYVAGIVGTRAIQFDHDLYEAMIVSRDPNLVLDSFTVSLWAKIDVLPGGHQAVVSFRDDFPTRGYILYAAPADKWEYWTGPGSGWHGLGSGDPLTDVIAGAWTHLAISYEQTGYAGVNLTGTKKLYVNGRLAATATDITLSWTDLATDLQIGAGQNETATHSFFYDGAVDDVQLYTYALDSVTIAQIYNTVTGVVVCVDERPQFDVVPIADDPSDPSYCIVDLRDLADWVSHWLDCNRVPGCLP